MALGESGKNESMEKSSSALRTIGEASEVLNVPQHVLRFWEKRFTQLKPVKRRGRRYYRPEDIALLERIKELLYSEGMTIKGAKKLLREAGNAEPQPDLFMKEEAVSEPSVSTEALAAQSGLRSCFAKEEADSLYQLVERLKSAKKRLDGALA